MWVCGCLWERETVCEREREREIESVCVCVSVLYAKVLCGRFWCTIYKFSCIHSFIWCVCVRVRVRDWDRLPDCFRVNRERERECMCLCVHLFVCESEIECVCVCVHAYGVCVCERERVYVTVFAYTLYSQALVQGHIGLKYTHQDTLVSTTSRKKGCSEDSLCAMKTYPPPTHHNIQLAQHYKNGPLDFQLQHHYWVWRWKWYFFFSILIPQQSAKNEGTGQSTPKHLVSNLVFYTQPTGAVISGQAKNKNYTFSSRHESHVKTGTDRSLPETDLRVRMSSEIFQSSQ